MSSAFTKRLEDMGNLTPKLEEGSLRDTNSEVMGDDMAISSNIESHDDVGSLTRTSTTQGLPDTTVIPISPNEGKSPKLKSTDGSMKQNDVKFETLTEGLAHIIVPERNPSPEPKKGSDLVGKPPQSVFYNPIQQFNRDLSVLAIRAYGEELFDSRRQKTISKKRKRGNNGPENLEAHRQGTAPTDRGGLQDPKMQEALEEPRGGANEQPQINERTPVLERNPSVANGAATTPGHEMDQVSVKDLRQVNLRILDALSASGLRALRYAKELPFTTSVVANDLSSTATESIKQNVAHNGLEEKIEVVTSNALTHMYSLVGNTRHSLKYNVIDLDPYGTAVPFLDAALQSLHSGGLLCVTCTDSGVWASTGYPEKAFSLYGGVSLSGPHCHEAGLRLILNSITMSAAKYGMAIEPLLSLSIDFYARVFVRIKHSAADVKFLAGKTMVVYNCDEGCGAWSTQMLGRNKASRDRKGGTYYKHSLAQGPSASQLCEHCGRKTHLAGPMYGGRLHSPQFIQRILDLLPTLDQDTYQTIPRIRGMLITALEEFLPENSVKPGSDLPEPVNTTGEEATPPMSLNPATPEPYPFFFLPQVLSKVIHCQTPPENALRGALKHLGYSTSRSHTKPGSIRTNAPWSVIWEVMREWVRQEAPIKPGACKEGTAGHVIMKGGLSQLQAEATNVQRIISEENAFITSPDQGDENGRGPSKLEVIFDERLGAESQKGRLVRYQMNPRANWGPMVRAKAQPPT